MVPTCEPLDEQRDDTDKPSTLENDREAFAPQFILQG